MKRLILIISILVLCIFLLRPGKVSAANPNADLVGTLTVLSGATTSATAYTFVQAGTHICIVATQTATASAVGAAGPVVPQVTSTTLNVQFANAVAANTVVGYICHGSF